MDTYQKKQMMAGISELTETVCLWYSDVPKRLPAIVLLLSQQGFPNATRVVLNWLGNYFEHCQNYPPGKFPNKTQVLFLIDSFVFFKTDQVQIQLTLTRELHLLEEICRHFQRQGTEPSKFLTFEALFGGRSNPSDNVEEHRQKILYKTVSMALSFQWSEVLGCAAMWLHTQNLSPSAIGLVESILMDFCDLLPSTSVALERLLDVCPPFVNQLLPCAFTHFCNKGYKDESFTQSMSLLVRIASDWLSRSPTVCLLHLTSHFQGYVGFHRNSARDRNTSLQSTMGPVRQMLLFCILHPLWTSSRDNGSKDEVLVVSKLFYHLLQSLVATPPIERDGEKVYIILRQDVVAIVSEIKRKLQGGIDPASAAAIQVELCLDRLAEAIQISNAAKHLEMSSDEIEHLCEGLPQSQLLDIVLASKND